MKPTEQNGTLKNLLYIVAGLGGISFIILIHEIGHFLFAKIFNIPTPYFSLGFGPTLYAFTIKQTTFKIALLPLGGYVEMDPEALNALPYVPKMLIIFAGILFNLIFAYAILLYYALCNQTVAVPIINTITPDSPADRAGLQPNDVIITCNQQPIDKNADLITKIIASCAQTTIALMIKRNDTLQEIPATLNQAHPLYGENIGWLGITLKEEKVAQPSFYNALQKGHAQYTNTLQEMSNAVSKIITKKNQQNVLMGPIGIISMIGKSLAINPRLYWFILAIISLNIGLFNIIPLPFFDGGKALIWTIEAVTGKEIPATTLWFISTIFLALFMLLIMRVTIHDIKRLLKK